MEKEPVWRDIWQEIIEASKKDLEAQNNHLPELQKITEKYPDDKMILFEKGITYEALNDGTNAQKYYKEAASEESGLPVKHWRERAKYFLERIENNGGRCTLIADPCQLNTNNDLFPIQWDTYYNAHYYANLTNYIRYLAISSLSRINSEPSMAIVVFRTCLEIGLWTYFKKDADELNQAYKLKTKRQYYDIPLNNLLDELNNKKKFKKGEYNAFHEIRKFGNEAAHEFKKYKDSELIKILDNFNKTLFFLNEHAKEVK